MNSKCHKHIVRKNRKKHRRNLRWYQKLANKITTSGILFTYPFITTLHFFVCAYAEEIRSKILSTFASITSTYWALFFIFFMFTLVSIFVAFIATDPDINPGKPSNQYKKFKKNVRKVWAQISIPTLLFIPIIYFIYLEPIHSKNIWTSFYIPISYFSIVDWFLTYRINLLSVKIVKHLLHTTKNSALAIWAAILGSLATLINVIITIINLH